MSEIDKLERLKKLLDDGAITEQEYSIEKSKLLSKKVSNTSRSISILLVASFAFAGIYFLTSEKQEIPVLEAETIGTTTTTEPLEELIVDDSLVVDSIEDVIAATVFISVQGIFTAIDENTFNSVEYQFSSAGSGFLISSNGYIVTNQHVVSGASIVEVYFADNEIPKIAKVIATSECSDLALLKIDVQESIYFEWAIEKPSVGTEIYAAGYPLSDREFTLLDGIITKKDADGEMPWASVESIFEHNAEIKPGNSGGPLLGKDEYKVYGVNFALDRDDKGIGAEELAINVDTAKNIINSMLDGSHMSGFGINGQQIMGYGLFLESVDLGSPLDIAGLKGGDIITKLAGINLVDKSTLKTYCDILSTQTNSGKVLIEYLRIDDGKSYSTILNTDSLDSSVQASDTTTTTTTTTTTLAPTTTTSTTTTTTTVPIDGLLLKYTDIKNEFPEIPYCKYVYKDVAKEIYDYFIENNIRLTIREMLVETDNTDCHGLVSGANFSYEDLIVDGYFVEITVESTITFRKFPTYISNSPNAKGNNESFFLICDLTGDAITEKFWTGELGTQVPGANESQKIKDTVFYSQPNNYKVNLNDPNTNCAADKQLDDLCYWKIQDRSGEYNSLSYRHFAFDVEKQYSNQHTVTNSCSEEEINQKILKFNS